MELKFHFLAKLHQACLLTNVIFYTISSKYPRHILASLNTLIYRLLPSLPFHPVNRVQHMGCCLYFPLPAPGDEAAPLLYLHRQAGTLLLSHTSLTPHSATWHHTLGSSFCDRSIRSACTLLREAVSNQAQTQGPCAVPAARSWVLLK